MNNTNQKLLTDLEIFSKVIPQIDKTITVYGKSKFQELFKTYYFNKGLLERRRILIESIINNTKTKNKIIKKLNKIKKLEGKISWLFAKNEDEDKDLYFKREFFNTKETLNISVYDGS